MDTIQERAGRLAAEFDNDDKELHRMMRFADALEREFTAVRDAERERCARIAVTTIELDDVSWLELKGYNKARTDIAAAIREGDE